MGEGWSDFYALSLLTQHEDNLGGNYPMGGYATYQFNSLQQNYYYGIRRYPYSTNMNVNPLTFKDIDVSTASSHPGIPVSPIITSSGNAVHRQGEIWCSMLWDMRVALLQKYAPTTRMSIAASSAT
jgi:extracellular elastinolytic metalloproteinase